MNQLPRVTGVRDPSCRAELERAGYARLGPLLSDVQVESARRLFDHAVRSLDRPIGDRWFPTILLPEEDVRDHLSDGLRSIIQPLLAPILDFDHLDLTRVDYSVKPASPMSELGPHQDFSLIDERRWTSLYFWIPLSDTDVDNGTLHVVPGSHRFANRIRSQHVPSYFDEVLDLVHEEGVGLDCAAGELILMVSGLVHYSPANRSEELRLAAHGIAKPSEAPLVFFYADDETPSDLVECYQLGIDDYVRCIRSGRPEPGVPCAGTMARPPASMDRERFVRGIAASRSS
jgi:hypothetical protein